jgi:ATP-dependent DNA ligase
MEAKIEKKMENGYVDSLEAVNDTAVVSITLDDLPKEFCPCKPISKPPKKVTDNLSTYGQRKRDGHCIITVKTESGVDRVYSRGMEEITPYMIVIPEVQAMLSSMKNGTMILNEFVFVKGGKDNTRQVGKLTRKKDPIEVLNRYNEFKSVGTFEVVPFDIMYSEGNFIGDSQYRQRHQLLNDLGFSNVPEIIEDWKAGIEEAKKAEWEGYVLRNDKDSSIHYSLNGKADKAGSWKYVFVKEDDFVVVRADKGKAGKQEGLYAQFYLAQYMDGALTEFGKCGPGMLKHDRLAELTQEIDSGDLELPFTIQVEYRDRQPDSGKLQFPQFVEVRYDKQPKECITDFTIEE